MLWSLHEGDGCECLLCTNECIVYYSVINCYVQIEVCRMKHQNKEKFSGNKVSVVLIIVYSVSLRCMIIIPILDAIVHEETPEDVRVV